MVGESHKTIEITFSFFYVQVKNSSLLIVFDAWIEILSACLSLLYTTHSGCSGRTKTCMIMQSLYDEKPSGFCSMLTSLLLVIGMCKCLTDEHVCSQERLPASGRAGPVPAPDCSVASHRRAHAAQPRVVRYNVLLALRLPLSPTPVPGPATSSYVRPGPPSPLDPAWACFCAPSPPCSRQALVTHTFCSSPQPGWLFCG